jgi:hypothetical protein
MATLIDEFWELAMAGWAIFRNEQKVGQQRI